MKYYIKKALEYFFPKIEKNILENVLEILSRDEKEIFIKMGTYDKMHSLEVYKKICETELKKDRRYLKLALLHDCGKEKSSIILRGLHKLGFRTKLRNHPFKGYEKMINVDRELAFLIKNHHVENFSEKMTIFQECDDRS